jgi:hypothetical protein
VSGVNQQVHIVGPPGCGKTTLAVVYVRQALERGWWVFVHDQNEARQYRELGAVHYATAAAWREAAAAAARERRPLSRLASVGGSSGELVRLLLELGARHNRAESVRMPMLLVLDEASLTDTSGATHMADVDNALLSNRRHRGIGVVFLQQRIKQRPVQFYEMATDVILFRIANASKLGDLEDALGLEAGTLARVVPHLYLPDRQDPRQAHAAAEYVHVSGGRLR